MLQRRLRTAAGWWVELRISEEGSIPLRGTTRIRASAESCRDKGWTQIDDALSRMVPGIGGELTRIVHYPL